MEKRPIFQRRPHVVMNVIGRSENTLFCTTPGDYFAVIHSPAQPDPVLDLTGINLAGPDDLRQR